MGVIRNIYFNEDREDIGQLLLNKAEEYFSSKNLEGTFAFNHALGLSSNAYHGKLHENKAHIGKLLMEDGYNIEHENIYYSIDLLNIETINESEDIQIIREDINEYNEQVINLIYENKKVGESIILYLDKLKSVYMNSIWINSHYSNKGLGSKFIKLICNDLMLKGYIKLDLDTAKNNLIAQGFYEKNNFTNKGITRSYFR